MFYVLIFSILAVVLVVGGLTTMSRRSKNLAASEDPSSRSDASRRNRKAQRAQSQHDRRKRH